MSIGVQFLFASQKDDSEREKQGISSHLKKNVILNRRLRNCSYAGAKVGFWKVEVSIGVQFLFAAQKDDRDSEEQGTVRMLEQWLVLEVGSKYWRTVPICCAKG
ncbi:hypothetical protein [Sphingobacterium sp.]|uniref:hypothetical protein n=1 Tax=Sphingobacterium sp. TaxID=341027 RepID=UPI0028A79C52|nr:hypothetical protein [Sphingobacterium sp.]